MEDNHREATIKLIEELSKINESIANQNQTMENVVSELSNLGSSDVTLSDEEMRKQNYDFLLQSHFFNKAFGNE